MRVGFIGVGGIAQAHINNLKQFDDVQIVAVTDKDEERAANVAQDTGATAYQDAETMFEKADLEAVYICVPPFAHGDAEWTAIRHGVPMYVEKPLGIDIEFAEKLAEEVDKVGRINAVGFQLRYIDTAEKLREKLAGRTLGMVMGKYACPMVMTPWWRKRDLSGGQLVEQAIHVVDMIRYITQDEFATINTYEALRIHTDLEGMDIPDVTVTNFKFASGAVGSMDNTCGLVAGWDVGIDIVAKDLAAHWNPGKLVLTDANGTEEIEPAPGDSMAAADRAFIDAVAAKNQSLVRSHVADALLTQRAVVAAAKSAADGSQITLIG